MFVVLLSRIHLCSWNICSCLPYRFLPHLYIEYNDIKTHPFLTHAYYINIQRYYFEDDESGVTYYLCFECWLLRCSFEAIFRPIFALSGSYDFNFIVVGFVQFIINRSILRIIDFVYLFMVPTFKVWAAASVSRLETFLHVSHSTSDCPRLLLHTP